MITQSTYRESTELGKEMTLGVNLSQSFDESENSQMSMGMGEMKVEGVGLEGMMYSGQQHDVQADPQLGYPEQYYNQWCGADYNNLNYYQGYPGQQQYGYPQQYPQQMYREDVYQMGYHRSDSPMTGYHPPARSPTGSHSTPSPHSQEIVGDDMSSLELKKSHEDSFRAVAPISQQPKKPKSSRRKKKRDPNEPQKPVSAYALFFRDSQASIKGRNPNLSFGDVSKMVASLWDSLDSESKALYKKRTELAKKEYLRQLAAYRASLVSKGQGDEMFGFPGYGYPGHMGLGQNIPPHPPSAPSQPAVNQHTAAAGLQSPGRQGFMQTNEFQNQAGPGSDCTGNSPPCLSLPVSSQGHHSPLSLPVSSHQGQISSIPGRSAHHPAIPGQTYQDKFGHNSIDYAAGAPTAVPVSSAVVPPGHFDGYGAAAGADRNHNQVLHHQQQQQSAGQCGRPGCGRPVTKSVVDGTESTYCSSECVVGQCREVYSTWSAAANSAVQHQQQQPAQPPAQQVK